MDNRISKEMINDLLYYTFRNQRFNPDIVDIRTVSKSEIMYSDIYEEYESDFDFNYFQEANFVAGAATAWSNAFTVYVKAVIDMPKWRIVAENVAENNSLKVVAYDDRGEIVLFDYSNPEDKALLDERTIQEIEKVLSGPDLVYDDEEEDY